VVQAVFRQIGLVRQRWGFFATFSPALPLFFFLFFFFPLSSKHDSSRLTYSTASVEALAVVFLVPFLWNVLARANHRRRWLNKLWAAVLGGGPETEHVRYAAAYTFAVCIFAGSFYRDVVFAVATRSSPVLAGAGFLATLFGVTADMTVAGFAVSADAALAYFLMAVGTVFVLAAFLRLGIVGTYLGGQWFGFRVCVCERPTI
jgi:hypothetical protein